MSVTASSEALITEGIACPTIETSKRFRDLIFDRRYPRAHMEVSCTAGPGVTVGCAPLYCFFDATETWSPAVPKERSFQWLFYRWDFGDHGCGYHQKLPHHPYRSRTVAFSALAVHIYETPGTYTARLTVEDPDGDIDYKTQTITVQDPDDVFGASTNVYVFANDEAGQGWSGAPTHSARTCTGPTDVGGRVVTSSWNEVISYMRDGPRRLALRRGDQFDLATSTPAIPATAGPGYVHAFGATGTEDPDISGMYDNDPLAKTTIDKTLIYLPQSQSYLDWRIENLRLQQANIYTSPVAHHIHSQRTYRGWLFYKLKMWDATNKGIEIEQWFTNPDAADPAYPGEMGDAWVHDIKAYVKCIITSGQYNSTSPDDQIQVYCGGRRTGWQDCRVIDSASHNWRFWWPRQLVLNNCYSNSERQIQGGIIKNQSGGAQGLNYGWPTCEHWVMSDNYFRSVPNGVNISGISTGMNTNPCPGGEEAVNQYGIYERNFMDDQKDYGTANGNSGNKIILNSRYTTVRNSIFVDGGRTGANVTMLVNTAWYPDCHFDPFGCEVVNNLIYRPFHESGKVVYLMASSRPDCIVKNNTAFTISPGAAILTYVSCPTPRCAANLVSVDPDWVDEANDDFHLQSGSSAIGAGEILSQVYDDYDGVRRPASPTQPDQGPFQYV